MHKGNNLESVSEHKEKFFDEISNAKYNLHHKSMKVKDLIRLYEKNLLLFDTEYQRTENVWNLKKQRLLIDSILRSTDISAIFLRQIDKNDERQFECIDGQQRLRCMIDFLRNRFAMTPDVTPSWKIGTFTMNYQKKFKMISNLLR